ncbi:MAG: type II toxin-antitoxin system PemK/MazF family toxin [bacterium]
MQLQYGHIYLVDFEPSVGHEYQKKRPAVIIEADKGLRQSSLVTIMPLTSQMEKAHQDDIAVRKNVHNRLFVDSVVKVHVITSFDRSRFIKRIGKMDDNVMGSIKAYLKKHFDI